MPNAKILLATLETDRELAEKYGEQGAEAYKAGLPRDASVLDGLVKGWWLAGWDRAELLSE